MDRIPWEKFEMAVDEKIRLRQMNNYNFKVLNGVM
jgi:hypothetical protein